jgi:hypothetical protein
VAAEGEEEGDGAVEVEVWSRRRGRGATATVVAEAVGRVVAPKAVQLHGRARWHPVKHPAVVSPAGRIMIACHRSIYLPIMIAYSNV